MEISQRTKWCVSRPLKVSFQKKTLKQLDFERKAYDKQFKTQYPIWKENFEKYGNASGGSLWKTNVSSHNWLKTTKLLVDKGDTNKLDQDKIEKLAAIGILPRERLERRNLSQMVDDLIHHNTKTHDWKANLNDQVLGTFE